MTKLIQRPMALLGLLLLILTAASQVITYNTEPAYARTMRAQGLPASLAELEAALPQVPPEQNAAVELQAAGQKLVMTHVNARQSRAMRFWSNLDDPSAFSGVEESIVNFEPRSYPVNLAELPDLERQALAELVEDEEVLAWLRTASQKPEVQFETNLETYFKGQFAAHLGQMRALDSYLSLLAAKSVLEKNTQKFMEIVRLQMLTAQALRNEPLPVAQSHRYSMLDSLVRTLEWGTNGLELNTEELTQLRKVVQTPQWDPEINQRMMLADFLGSRKQIESPWTAMTSQRDHPAPGVLTAMHALQLGLRLSGLDQLQRTGTVRAFRTYIARAAEPIPKRAASEQPVSRVGEYSYSPFAGLVLPYTYFMWYGRGGFPVLTMADTALAVEQFRLTRGRLPQELDELVPEFLEQVPGDPFAEDALKYRQSGEGYEVYSVGRDYLDSADLDYDRHRRNDIVFSVKFAPELAQVLPGSPSTAPVVQRQLTPRRRLAS